MNFSQKYHEIFDYQLVKSDFPKWKHKSDKNITRITSIKSVTRKKREHISKKKLIIAKKAANILSKIPTVMFVGVTGSLAMLNSKKGSDIDLLIITKKDLLWFTRLVILVILLILQIPVRRARRADEADNLCLNMWLDESDLVWNKKDRNVYTAHEIAQVIPLVNKEKTYEKFLWLNRWILNYWPFSVKITRYKANRYKVNSFISLLIEQLTFKLQYLYMKSKITRETITPARAIFHPTDWGKKVLDRLQMNS